MAGERETIWDIDPHTLKKHEILRRYWEAWLPIMSSWAVRVLFVDGFAGPGKYKGGEDGSPTIVLKAARDHRARPKNEVIFLFIERDKARADHLKQTIKTLDPPLPKNFKYQVVSGTFDQQMSSVLAYLDEQKKRLAPALVFVDPFGFSHTPFVTISRILQNPSSELLITFMYEEINRFLAHPEQPENYDALFGTPKWREGIKIADPEQRRRMIHDIYLEQLRTVAKHVRSFEMLNRGNRTDYFLFFATNNQLGLEKMKEAMWKVAPGGDYQFSDFTESSGILSLFGDRPDYDDLKQRLMHKFRGQQAVIEQVEQFVIVDTPFLRTHIRRGVLKPMEQAGKLSIVRAKPNRKEGTFPPGTVLQFE